MSFLFSLIAVFAFFPMVFAGLMTFSALRSKEYDFAMKSGAVFVVCLLIVAVAPKGAGTPNISNDCQYYGRFARGC